MPIGTNVQFVVDYIKLSTLKSLSIYFAAINGLVTIIWSDLYCNDNIEVFDSWCGRLAKSQRHEKDSLVARRLFLKIYTSSLHITYILYNYKGACLHKCLLVCNSTKQKESQLSQVMSRRTSELNPHPDASWLISVFILCWQFMSSHGSVGRALVHESQDKWIQPPSWCQLAY